MCSAYHGVSANMSGDIGIDPPDAGLGGNGTARVDVEDAGLCAGEEESGDEVIMYLLATGCSGDVTNIGVGIAKRGLRGAPTAGTNWPTWLG
jgi:hypothetical protein